MTRPGEFEVIRRHFAPLAQSFPGALNLTDDAAVLDVPEGRELVVTSDALVSGVHFLADDPPADIAAKALRVNLSDLASMGAQPLAYTLAAALSDVIDDEWLRAFAEGLGRDQVEFGIGLIGGDTVATPGPLTLSICAFGSVPKGRALRRSGANPGDLVFVSGTIGDATLGLAALTGDLKGLDEADRNVLVGRYRRPTPRSVLGPGLIGIATAAIDISDGLVADLGHICEVSEVEAVVEASRVPLSAAARKNGAIEQLLSGGDDYELLFCAPASAREDVRRAGAIAGVEISEIGRICAGSERTVSIIDKKGRPLEIGDAGFTHF
ncbi:MAG: thiamine-phosphate kinase [Rhodospirillales bacterium]|jgi:thiamine-monophosphate kinase|nr:thiamine-phosphate kinase [Rhodospirillales bacterium]